MDKKKRWYFHIWNYDGHPIGWGIYYPYGGNCQIYFAHEDFAAKQMSSLGDVMLFDNVAKIGWQRPYTEENNGESN